MKFSIKLEDKNSVARLGQLDTPHGSVLTPAFFPVGTQASVKCLSSEDLEESHSQGILANAYHLFLRPGLEIIKSFQGLHNFMSYKRPIITDSGGYQVFSLADLKTIGDSGVEFKSHIDGTKYFFSPEKVIDIQLVLKSDVFVHLDECIAYPAEQDKAKQALAKTINWAKRSFDYLQIKKNDLDYHPGLLGVIQGSFFKALRKDSVNQLVDIGFDLFSIGGISVGESFSLRYDIVGEIKNTLNKNKFCYLMGVGTPEDILEAVGLGVDLFDCVIPTRLARTGTAFTSCGKKVIRNASYKMDSLPIDSECGCRVCSNYSRGYIRHLINSNEVLGINLISYHNVFWFNDFLGKIRRAIEGGRYTEFKKQFLANYTNEENN